MRTVCALWWKPGLVIKAEVPEWQKCLYPQFTQAIYGMLLVSLITADSLLCCSLWTFSPKLKEKMHPVILNWVQETVRPVFVSVQACPLSPELSCMTVWLCVFAVIDTGVYKAVSRHISGQLGISITSGHPLFSVSTKLSCEFIGRWLIPPPCLRKSLISITSPLSSAGNYPHCHFCI